MTGEGTGVSTPGKSPHLSAWDGRVLGEVAAREPRRRGVLVAEPVLVVRVRVATHGAHGTSPAGNSVGCRTALP